MDRQASLLRKSNQMSYSSVPKINWDYYRERLLRTDPIKNNGRITQVVGLVLESVGPAASVGELCHLCPEGGQAIPAEIVGFRGDRVLLMPLADTRGIRPGCQVIATGAPHLVRVGDGLLGRILNGLGEFMDDGPSIIADAEYPVYNTPPHPLRRQRICEPIQTGIKAIDGLMTCGKGQRVGIFSGSGVGKRLLPTPLPDKMPTRCP
ncbi:MAG TPA: hypothetical protein PKH07_17155, partial [bacterium]|nr:hypothetical protein [bacterium]